jgi:hypothetical protein
MSSEERVGMLRMLRVDVLCALAVADQLGHVAAGIALDSARVSIEASLAELGIQPLPTSVFG